MRLEDQIEKLAALGLELDKGVTVDDLLYSYPREDYESSPFNLILLMFGSEVEREPWGRNICSRAYDLDMECISSDEDYVRIAERLCLVAGREGALADIQCSLDFKSDTGWLEYGVDDARRRRSIKIDSDWADPDVIEHVLRDLQRDGKRFFGLDNGQGSVYFYLDDATALELNRLSGDALEAALPD
ncbi:hypothetical protein [Methylovirgula sp. 4M-Z18]|uniref:hypothetical protein n=1 Tax=Methylovirgula sp. 4M-Z18 TaxID=2293567 RepID=UPI000E2E92B1|nr:hypothetical protein [Methylovirgula sp. 4M-Z18]RFB78956.1 hypothetical protein DYH55_14090 [Methylovirgula sp. 4M-Z18]